MDENVQVHTRTGVVGKTFIRQTSTAMTKENTQPRTIAGKIAGLKAGARRAALGDISNASHQTKVRPARSI